MLPIARAASDVCISFSLASYIIFIMFFYVDRQCISLFSKTHRMFAFPLANCAFSAYSGQVVVWGGISVFSSFFAGLKREFSGYNAAKLAKDVLAGLTVCAVALPLALAFGVSSGASAGTNSIRPAGSVCS